MGQHFGRETVNAYSDDIFEPWWLDKLSRSARVEADPYWRAVGHALRELNKSGTTPNVRVSGLPVWSRNANAAIRDWELEVIHREPKWEDAPGYREVCVRMTREEIKLPSVFAPIVGAACRCLIEWMHSGDFGAFAGLASRLGDHRLFVISSDSSARGGVATFEAWDRFMWTPNGLWAGHGIGSTPAVITRTGVHQLGVESR